MAQQAAELLLREETFNRTFAGGGGSGARRASGSGRRPDIRASLARSSLDRPV